jgi:hypothetical protein
MLWIGVITALITNYDSLFLLKEEELKYTLKEGYPIVKAGSIDALIAKTLDPYYQGTTGHLLSCLIAMCRCRVHRHLIEYVQLLLTHCGVLKQNHQPVSELTCNDTDVMTATTPWMAEDCGETKLGSGEWHMTAVLSQHTAS